MNRRGAPVCRGEHREASPEGGIIFQVVAWCGSGRSWFFFQRLALQNLGEYLQTLIRSPARLMTSICLAGLKDHTNADSPPACSEGALLFLLLSLRLSHLSSSDLT